MLLVPASQPALPVTVRLLELGLGNYFMSRILKMTPGKELPASMLRYSSPEQCRGSGVDPRSDIYALGCVLFELLVGQPPFRETALWDLVAAHAHEVPPRIRDFHPELPSALDDLVATMLEKDPAQRPFCMSEISAVLRAAVSKPAVVFEPAPAQPPAPIAKTVMLDTGPPVPEPARDRPATPVFRATRVLSPAEEMLVPRRPAAPASPHRVRHEPLPASDDTAPVRRRPRPPRGKRETVRVQKSSHAGLFIGVMLACIALGMGLFLWLLRPTDSQAKRTPLEDTPAREQPILPAVVPSPAPAVINTPPPATRRLAAELAEPKTVLTDKHVSKIGKNRVSSRGTKSHAPASPSSSRSPKVESTFPF
jgi:serine/threonine-protein kinase